MAAVRRIEVLKDGAFSVYGSDAVAGVVNIILYQEFTGTEVTAQQRDKLQQSDVAWMRDADFRKQQRGSLGWAMSNYAGADPTRTQADPRGRFASLKLNYKF